MAKRKAKAEVLTPVTNFRVHPVYALIFANILAAAAAIATLPGRRSLRRRSGHAQHQRRG